MKYIIIGAGITGLYLAYELITIKNISPLDIVIYEKSNRIGGRIYTYNNDDNKLKYSVGAGRLGKKHKIVMKLIKEFNLEEQIININKDKKYFVNEKLMNEKDLLLYYNSKFKSLNKLWSYAINKKVNVDTKIMNIHNYFSLFLSTNEVELLKISLGYITEIYDVNAYSVLLSLRADFDVKNNDFFVLKEGIGILPEVLYKYIIDKKIQVNFNSTLNDINDIDKYVVINDIIYNYQKLYVTITRNDYIKIPYFNNYNTLLNSVGDCNLLRIYAQYKDVWFKDLPKIVTQNKLQFIIPINYENGLIQISYSDSYNSNFWNNLKNEKEVKKHLKRMLNEMFPEKNIKDPEWITMHYWKSGSHFWKVGIDPGKTQKELVKIFSKKNIYILGETYCNRQAWIDGALETVDIHLKKMK
jgi:hypothetical protein